MKQALVLGAGGFIGRHCARALSVAGYQVTGIGHGVLTPDQQREWGLARWHVADVSADALMTYGGEPDILVQAAGSGSVAFSMTHPVQDYARSVATTLAALEFVRLEAPSCRIVLPSSAAVYGNARDLPIGVDAPIAPVSPYGAHKVIAEDLCRSYGRHFGVHAAIVRLFSVYGIGLRKQLLWDAWHKLQAGDQTFFGTGDERRDWLHVEDAASLILAAARNASPDCPIVNGGTGEMIANRDVLGWMAASVGHAEPPRFTNAERGGDPVDYQADIAQALAWGWKPKRALRTEIPAIAAWIAAGAR